MASPSGMGAENVLPRLSGSISPLGPVPVIAVLSAHWGERQALRSAAFGSGRAG
jgi:hypothetical protein